MSAEDLKDRLAEHLAELTAVPAPPGHEEELRRRFVEFLPGGASGKDRLGNTWWTTGSGDEHLLVLAHLDEVGLVVRKIEPDGFLRVHRVGGIPERVLMAQGALVLGADGPVFGTFGTVAHHLASEAVKARVVPSDEQYLDVGASSADDARERLGLEVGDFVVYQRSFHRDGDAIWANAIDDRGGLAVLIELARRLEASDVQRRVTLLATVQEEFSLRGLLPAIRQLAPDLIMTIDISPACDTPDLREASDIHLGGGPVIHHYSFHGRGTLAGVIPPRWLTDELRARAADAGIAHQVGAFFGGLTDGSFAQLEGKGAPTVEIGIPCRYTHSPLERADLGDLAATCELLHEAATQLPLQRPSSDHALPEAP